MCQNCSKWGDDSNSRTTIEILGPNGSCLTLEWYKNDLVHTHFPGLLLAQGDMKVGRHVEQEKRSFDDEQIPFGFPSRRIFACNFWLSTLVIHERFD